MPTPDNDLLQLVAQLRTEVDALQLRIKALESRPSAVPAAGADAPTEAQMLAIAAAVAAFLGVRVRIQQVRLVHSNAWAQVGRIGVHASHRLN